MNVISADAHAADSQWQLRVRRFVSMTKKSFF